MPEHDEGLARQTIRKYQAMLKHRDGMRQYYRILAKYVLMREAMFGDFKDNQRIAKITVSGVSDDTAVDCASAASNAFAGALWPNNEESFELTPHPLMRQSPAMEAQLQTEEINSYYEECTRRAREPFGQPEAGFLVAFGEHMREQVVMGTSGIMPEEQEQNDEVPCVFRSLSVETSLIDEDANNRVDTVAQEYSYTVRQAAEKYKVENLAPATRKLLETPEGEDEMLKIIQLVRPRPGGTAGDVKAKKPWASIHMEVGSNHVLKNDGMDELGAFVVRFDKRPNELYGRSLAGNAIQSIKELNVLRKSATFQKARNADPPTGHRQEQLGGAGFADLSPGAKTTLYDTGIIPQSRPPVEVLVTPSDTRGADERCDKLEQKMLVKFLLDKLFDFANKTRMTLGEAKIRQDFRNQALGNYFARQMTELLHPLIMWVVKLYWLRKYFGLHPVKDEFEIALMKMEGQQPFVMPKIVADFVDRTGKLPFAIMFISPAARAMRADAQQGLEELTNYVMALITGGMPDAADNFDADEAVRLYQRGAGAPNKALRARDKRDKARKARQDAQAQMMQLEVAEQQSGIQKNQMKAAKDAVSAGIQPGAMNIGA